MVKKTKEAVYLMMPRVHRCFVLVCVCAAALTVFECAFAVYVGASPSVYGKIFIMARGAIPKPGDLAVFSSEKHHPVLRGRTLIKYVGALQGEKVRVCRDYVVVGRRKLFLEGGRRPIDARCVPEGQVFVFGTHPESLDSRYASVGFLPMESCVGVVRGIFA